jgi:transcriptional regulator with XRE-family HTH domain
MKLVKDPILFRRIGERIRALRKKHKLSQLELAVRMDNHAEQIGRIERGELNVSISTLNKIAQCFQIEIHELLHFED